MIFLVACFTALAVNAQTVTVKVKGNRNHQVLIDGNSYTVNTTTSSTTAVNTPIVVTGLSLGQHTVQVMRSNPNTGRITEGMKTTFTLQSGYDMNITVSANGGIQLNQTKIKNNNSGSQYRTPMTDASFNVLLNNISNQRSVNSRVVAITNAFNNTANYFTSAQIRSMLNLVNSQSYRLSLAKTGYKTVTDPTNYSSIYNILSSQARRNELSAYVSEYDRLNPGYNNNNSGTVKLAMSQSAYNAIYADAQGQWPESAKKTYLSTVFGNSYNYFTTTQAKQLISVVTSETERLQLAKEAWDNVVDQQNFNQMNDLLSYQTSRNDLANYVNNQNVNNPRIPMTATNYNNLYLAARDQYSYSEKLSYIDNVFVNANNFFTISQVRQLLQLVTNENDRLRLAKSAWDNITDQSNYTYLLDLFNSQAARNNFSAYANSNGTDNTAIVNTAMSDASFTTVYNKISNTWGFGAKMSALTNLFNDASNYFTVTQTRQLIQLVSDESNRLQLAKLAFNNVVDPENYYTLNDLLSSQSSRNELDVFVKTNTTTGYIDTKVPMTMDAFTNLYNNISNQWGLGVKMSSLTEVFASATNYFTTAQARQLIQLVSLEDNRLQLAKSSYDNIVDQANFNQLYDVLSSQSSKTELQAYVNSYSYNR